MVTGASRGIGLEVARMLCAEDARVLLVARDAARLEAAAAECAAVGGETAVLAVDVTADDAGERMAGAAREAFGDPDVLVNNAGTARSRDLDEVPEADWYAAWELNVMAPMRAMRAVAPRMSERGWGRIVNVASSAAKRPSANMPEYSVAKAAELSLSRLFADRYAGRGVLVNAVCPGPTASELWMAEGGLLDQSRAPTDRIARTRSMRRPRSGRSDAWPRSARSPRRSSSCARSARATSPESAWSVDGGTVQVII